MNYSTYLASLGRIPILAVAAILTGSFVSYCLGLAVYRLYLSPIATFPGPKLAALTHWYEVYYDLFAKGTGGQFTWEIKRMHEKYGPIVRINPDELHIDDAEYWNDVYCSSTSSRPMDKPTKFKYRFGIPEATFSTTFAEQHRERRAALSPFFSKQHIRTLNDKLLEIIGHISHRLSTEYAGTGQVISISNMWSSMTSDIITDLAFSRSLNCSAAPEFKSPFSLAMQSLIWTAHWNAHFKFLVDVMDLIPEGILGFLAPSMKPILGYRVPAIQARLKAELAEAMPDPNVILSWVELEQRPYLSAVITESLRLSYGQVQRIPRVNRLHALKYNDWVIPPGVIVLPLLLLLHSGTKLRQGYSARRRHSFGRESTVYTKDELYLRMHCQH